MEKIKLSIIVPVYNVEQYIKKCIATLLVDGCENYEIIVVNDGTRDHSIEVVKENYNDPRIRIIEQENGGLSSARNYGIANARGEYVWCFDSDDWAETNCIPQIISELEGIDLLYFNCYFRNYDDNHSQELKKLDNEAKTGMELACKGFWHPSQFYIMRKDFLETNDLHYTEGICHEDSLLTPVMIVKSNSVKCFKQPVYHYRQRGGSIMNSPVSPKRINNLLFVISGLMRFGENLPSDVRYKWGRCIAQLTNEVLMCSQRCSDIESNRKVKGFVNRNSKVFNYLIHSGKNNKFLAVSSLLFFGNLYFVYSFAYKWRYKN